ncbi:MAG: hypothetical protein JKX78_08820 [Alteromonadaceae bacterium]|nr:hypothetical protein [Alteromonadaceae bacterium]
MTKNITKYLANYAEQETALLMDFPSAQCFTHSVVIPAYKESNDFIQRLVQSELAQQNVLFIIVINQPDSDNDTRLQQQLFQHCNIAGELVWQHKSLSLMIIKQSNSALLIVDRFTSPIPEKLGVGLARKLGTDLALALVNKKQIQSSWLCSTDADVHLPKHYFNALSNFKNSVAACYNFYHYSDDKNIHQANFLYEQALRYYVAGLTYAKSPYDFFTIGSILAFNTNAYASVRGFPKRSAGEDFYLLNKLAKLGKVSFIKDCVIKIDARTSDRVPFGTGPAVTEILALQAAGQEYCYYHPEVFEHLKQVLNDFKSLWAYRQQLSLWYNSQQAIICDALKSIGLDNFVKKQNEATEQQFTKQLIVWFDAFKTLKFIHALREYGLADIPLKDAIALASFSVMTEQ